MLASAGRCANNDLIIIAFLSGLQEFGQRMAAVCFAPKLLVIPLAPDDDRLVPGHLPNNGFR